MSESDRQARAGEYVIGTMPADERSQFELELASDPALAELVRQWEGRLAGLNALTPEQDPDPQTWQAIERALERMLARETANPAAPAPDYTGASAAQGALGPLRRSRARWRAAALAFAATAAALVVYVNATTRKLQETASAAQSYVAVVDRGGALPALLVQVDTVSGIVTIRSLAAERPPPGRSLELWYIAASGAPPRSLGVLDPARATAEIPSPAPRAALSGATLAVSVEPEGGSPTGAPTGQVIYSGKLIAE